jgi:hypothetical protein
LGKRARQPIKRWGCEGDHLYRDCPQKEVRMRNVHHIQEATTVEEVGRNIPRIYVSLENQHADYQSNMIEVEGKIVNQLFAILIDSGASHVEKFSTSKNLLHRFQCEYSRSGLRHFIGGHFGKVVSNSIL